MKYISLFSGIGGFEIAIHNIFPQAKCLGYSEIDKFALKVYKHHFPNHKNLGNIEAIKEKDIKALLSQGGCDLLVAGFPCKNLSSLSFYSNCNSEGLHGPKSGLFWKMLKVIKWIQKHNPKNKKLNFVIENNASMKKVYKETITSELQKLYKTPIFCNMLNGADFGVQTRKRLYWTNIQISNDKVNYCQSWKDILEPKKSLKDYICSEGCLEYYNTKLQRKGTKNVTVKFINNEYKFITKECDNNVTRWQTSYHSDTKNDKSTPVTTARNLNILVHRNSKNKILMIRYFHPLELERLFFIPDGWVSDLCSKTRCQKLLGNTVIVKVIEFILGQMKL